MKDLVVVVNVGLYRTGSTTLAKAAELAGFQVYREFPDNVTTYEMKLMLTNPKEAIDTWWKTRGIDEMLQLRWMISSVLL